jgi:hypothetical protein
MKLYNASIFVKLCARISVQNFPCRIVWSCTAVDQSNCVFHCSYYIINFRNLGRAISKLSSQKYVETHESGMWVIELCNPTAYTSASESRLHVFCHVQYQVCMVRNVSSTCSGVKICTEHSWTSEKRQSLNSFTIAVFPLPVCNFIPYIVDTGVWDFALCNLL